MDKRLLSQNKNTKLLKLEHNGQSIEVALNYVATRDVVQARYVDCAEGRITRWKAHGSFFLRHMLALQKAMRK